MEIWKIFATQGTLQHAQPLWVDEKFLETVSECDLNGREIKNTVRVAHALAVKAGRALEADDIHRTLRCLKSFDDDFRQQTATKKSNFQGKSSACGCKCGCGSK